MGGGKLQLEGLTIEKIKEIVHLEQPISFKNKGGKEISRQIEKAWNNFWALKAAYKWKIDIKFKNKILESVTLLILTYGSQNRANTKHQMGRIKTTQWEKENMWGIKITKIRKCTGARDSSKITRKLKWRYAGHPVKLQKDTLAKKALEWYPIGGKGEKEDQLE